MAEPDPNRGSEFQDLPALDKLGSEVAAAAHRHQNAAGRLRRLWLARTHSSLTMLVVLSLGGVGGAAYAGTRLLTTGEPVPPREQSPTPGSSLTQIVPGNAMVLRVRAQDPDGGPPWGLRVYRTRLGTACVQVGRVLHGKLGILGQDGVFGDDGRFHELPVQAEGCGGLDANGQFFFSGDGNSQTASGYDGSGGAGVGGCETALDRKSRTIDTVKSLRAALRLQLWRHEGAAARIERRVIARYEARARMRIPLCPTRGLRDLVYGFEGSQAQKVVLSEHGRTVVTLRPNAAESGAYLHVLRGSTSDHTRLQRRTFYNGGIVCGRGVGVHQTAGCSPPPGFVAAPLPKPLPPPPSPSAPADLKIEALPGLSLRFTPPMSGRYSVVIECGSQGTYGPPPSRRLVAGKPQTLRIYGPLPPGCQPRAPGTLRAASTGQIVGLFKLKNRR